MGTNRRWIFRVATPYLLFLVPFLLERPLIVKGYAISAFFSTCHSLVPRHPSQPSATPGKDLPTYWEGPNPHRITKHSTDNIKSSGDDTLRSPSKNSTMNNSLTTMHPVRETTIVSKAQKTIYKGCDTDKLCFGMPPGCVVEGFCHTLVTIAKAEKQYELEMLALSDTVDLKYVAVGFSNDHKMGDDSVLECVLGPLGTVNLYTSYNKGKNNIRNDTKNGVSLISSSYADKEIHCKFTLEFNLVSGGREYNLIKDRFYILLAAGSRLNEKSVGYHLKRCDSTGSPQYLSYVKEIKRASKLLLRLHGAFMVTAWLLFASTGILLARYFKSTWTGTHTCGKNHWFAWHRILMLVAWGLTAVAFVIIFIDLGGWSNTADLHAIFGTITTALATIQPIMATFRPDPNEKGRPLFNWAHWFVGNTAFILSVITIFFAVNLAKAELPIWLDWIMLAYVAFFCFIYVLFAIVSYFSEEMGTKMEKCNDMIELSNSRTPLHRQNIKLDAPYSSLRKLLLAIFIVVILPFTITIIVIIVLAPITENWITFKKLFSSNVLEHM